MWPIFAFDYNTTNPTYLYASAGHYSTSTAYFNTTSYTIPSLGTYSGEWLKISLPSEIILSKYSICGDVTGTSQSPGTWNIIGTNDGNTWTLVDSQTNITWASVSLTKNFTVSGSSTPYNQYAIIVSKLAATGGPCLVISEFRLYS